MTKGRKAALAACVLAALLGLALLLQPAVKRERTERTVSRTAKAFLSAAVPEAAATEGRDALPEDLDVPYPALLEAMEEYNRALFQDGQSGITDNWDYARQALDLEAYGIADGVVGVLSIPKLEQELPIYLGATADHLASGVAQMTETSMPIGGESTNCVLAGHRGWNGAPFLRYIERLEIGDRITITNLWGTLTYEVSGIKIIEPYETESLFIQPGRDMVTLLTCHPYASGGRYRYLVFCDRVADGEADPE